MGKKTVKAAAIALTAGMMLQFGGCLGGILNPQQLLRSAVVTSIVEFATDNDAIFDLFEDGNVTAAQ